MKEWLFAYIFSIFIPTPLSLGPNISCLFGRIINVRRAGDGQLDQRVSHLGMKRLIKMGSLKIILNFYFKKEIIN